MDTASSEPIISEDGKLNVLGMDVRISDIVGEKLVTQWMSQLSAEQVAAITKALDEYVFNVYTADDITRYTLNKTQRVNSWKDKDTLIWEAAKKLIQERIGQDINDKVEEIICSDAYKKRVNSIAEELVEYATEGYKNDLKEGLRERLVCNVIDPEPKFAHRTLHSIVNEILDERMDNASNYIHY